MTLQRPTISQQRQAYRNAVELSIVEFYGKSPLCARELVDAWWKRISPKPGFKSGLFMHSEAINTAADLAGEEVISISPENEDAYRRLLTKARNRANGNTGAPKSPISVHPGTMRIWSGKTKAKASAESKAKGKEAAS